MNLRPYQRDGLDAVASHLLQGINRQLLQKPTGTGKTVTFAELPKWPAIHAWLNQFPERERRMLVIAHREELLDQAAEKIRRAHPELVVTIDQADRVASRYSDVVVASIQTLQAQGFARLQRLLSTMVFRIVVVDEAHHTAARTYRDALAMLGFLPRVSVLEDGQPDTITQADLADVHRLTAKMAAWDKVAPKDRLLLGVTATPNRSDAVGLSCVYQQLVYSYRLRDAIKDGWLVSITPYAIETDTSLDNVRTNRGEFVQSALSEAVNTDNRNSVALSAWVELAENVPTIAFTVDVAHAHEMARTWRDAGYPAAAISGETPKDDRRRILAEFKRGDIVALMNCMVLTEGTDLPNVGCILHAKPTKSATLYEQMTGRGLRPLPGDPVGPERATATEFAKPTCIVIDIVDIAKRHSLQTAPVLYGLPPGVLTEGQPLEELAETIEQLLEKTLGFDIDAEFADGKHLTLAELQKRAELVDIWKIPDVTELGPVQLRWMKVSDSIYQVEYPWNNGYERLRLERDMLDHWSIEVRFQPPKDEVSGVKPAATQRSIGAQILELPAAARLAEAYVEQYRGSEFRMKSTTAGWRGAPATEKQLAVLARRRIPHDPRTLTKGQASDLLDLATAMGSKRPNQGRRARFH